MNINLILALERDFTTIGEVAKTAASLSTDGTAMPDGKGTVASRFIGAVVGFVPTFLALAGPIGLSGALPRLSDVTETAPAPAASVKTDLAADSSPAPVLPTLPAGAIRCTQRASSDLVKAVGDFHLYEDRSHILIFIPGDVDPTLLPLQPIDPHGWVLSEHVLGPTLTPSIFRDPPTGWHGWLTDGVLAPVPSAAPQKPAITSPEPVPVAIQPPANKVRKFWQAGMGPMPRDD